MMSTMKKLLGDKRYTGILLAIILGARTQGEAGKEACL